MAAPSYSAALTGSPAASSGPNSKTGPIPPAQTEGKSSSQTRDPKGHDSQQTPRKRAQDPTQQPQRETDAENNYILTLSTDHAHHERMNALRKKYFPPRLYRIGAHITLFHALPESKLKSAIVPTIQEVCSSTEAFSINAHVPIRLGKRGLGILIRDSEGGFEIRRVHERLLRAWMPGKWLSQQDRGSVRPHYTVMNKVDDPSVVDQAYEELRAFMERDTGTVDGVLIWQYRPGGRWKFVRKFTFTGGTGGHDEDR